ncbi:MAG: type II toxin-antitoxin system VapC family toxin [Anaerolineales bacterium]
MKYLLDTCVISELIARQRNPAVIGFIDALDADDVYLSVVTLGEIRRGIEKLTDSPRKQILQAWLEDDLLIRFDRRILPLDVDVFFTWATLAARLETQGIRLPAMDALLAATALAHKLTLVTRNERDFEASGVTIINPWRLP